jgi:hypothetical protein
MSERRRIAILGAAIGLGSAAMLLLMDKHPHVAIVWMGVLGVVMAYVIAQLLRIRKSGARSRR